MSESALSFTAQPNFAKLVDQLTATDGDKQQLALVCGAGLSADAGLPSWNELVARMCSAVEPEKLQDVVRADPTEDLRKVDYIVRLRNASKDLADILKEALYRDFQETAQSGRLADAIARLSGTWNGSAKLLTTNFDDQLERALRSYYDEEDIKTFSLEDTGTFEGLDTGTNGAGVMHLHGMVAPNRQTLEPLVLSQSFFLKHGQDVQDIVRDSLASSQLSILVGVSLADPNLIGPLNYLSGKLSEGECLDNLFLLVAPDPIRGISPELTYEYAKQRCDYFEHEFRINTILLRSYAQVAQLIYELSAALCCPVDYRCNDGRRSQRYGYRFGRELTKAYSALGASPAHDGVFDPAGDTAADISNRLHKALVRDNGPSAVLRERAGKVPDYELEDLGIDRSVLRDEHFGLFLWLRTRVSEHPDEDYAPSVIRLIGCSAYVHREAWSLDMVVPIDPQSGYPAADALFYGRAIVASLGRPGEKQMWRSCIASPITVVSGQKTGDASCQIGAITLNSTHQLPQGNTKSGWGANEPECRPSILSFLNATEKQEVAATIEQAAIEAINNGGAVLAGSPSS